MNATTEAGDYDAAKGWYHEFLRNLSSKPSVKISYLKALEVITLMSWMFLLDIFLWYFCRHNRENFRSTDRKSKANSTGTLSKTIH